MSCLTSFEKSLDSVLFLNILVQNCCYLLPVLVEQMKQIVTEEVEEEEKMNNISDEMEETDNVDWIEVTNYGDEQQNTNNQIEVQMVAVSSETNKLNESEEESNHPSSSDFVIF